MATAVAVAGSSLVFAAAAVGDMTLEAEDGATGATVVSLDTASGGSALKFGAVTATPGANPAPAAPTAGGRADTICGGTFASAMGGSTEKVPAASGKTLEVGSGKAHASLSSALSAAAAGDNILVTPGTYSELGNFNKSGSNGKCVTIAGNGGKAIFKGGGKISGSYIRLINIGLADSEGFALNSNGISNVALHNVEVAGAQDGGLYFTDSNNILIDGCDVHGTNSTGTGAAGEALSIADGTTDAEVRYCKVHDNGEEGIDVKYSNDKNTNTKIHHNEVYNNRGPNIYIDGVNGVEVYNNKIYGTTEGSKPGLVFGSEGQYAPEPVSRNIKVYNNEIYDNASSGIGTYTESGGSIADVEIYGNTLRGNNGGINVDGITNANVHDNTVDGVTQ